MAATDAAFRSKEPGNAQCAGQQKTVPETGGRENVIFVAPTGTTVFHHGNFILEDDGRLDGTRRSVPRDEGLKETSWRACSQPANKVGVWQFA